MRVNGNRYDITHRRTEEFPVAAHFNSGTHVESDMLITDIELARSRDACLRKIREQVDDDLGYFVPFRDESHGR